MRRPYFVFGILLVSLILVCGCEAGKSQKAAVAAKLEPNQAAAVVKEQVKPVEPNVVIQTAVKEVNSVQAKVETAAIAVDVNAKPVKAEPNPATCKAADKTAVEIFTDKYGDLLKNYINDKGQVNYGQLKRKKSEISELQDELRKLTAKEYAGLSADTRKALWINVYNLEMLKIISDNYPIESQRIARMWWPPNSIRHIQPNGVVGTKKWDGCKFVVMQEEFTLSEVEERFFVKEFNDPRIFFCLSYASVSGPPLHNKPYACIGLDAAIDEQVRKYIGSEMGFKIDKPSESVYISAIFEEEWNGNRFVGKYGTDKKFKSQPASLRAVLNFAAGYIGQKEVNYLETGNYTVKYINYDWRLNE